MDLGMFTSEKARSAPLARAHTALVSVGMVSGDTAASYHCTAQNLPYGKLCTVSIQEIHADAQRSERRRRFKNGSRFKSEIAIT